ncbi:MAG: glycosyltransferase [Lachnospiraceae bacterium]|nr:glycosyltransferase [Lachnospiraceae bacterium]
MAKVSVIIPCFNAQFYIDRCLTSVTSQSIGIDSLEIICVDDASTDNTWEKLQQWEQRYPNQIMILHFDTNSRQGTARNVALQYATSPWISFVDSDDWIEPDYYQKLLYCGEQTASDIVICKTIRDSSLELSFLDNTKTGEPNRFMVIDSLEKRKLFLVLRSMDSLACAKIVRKDFLLENQIFFPEYLTYEDTYWGSLLHLYTNRVYFLEETLYHYYINEHSSVLQSNSEHHLDLLTVQMRLWNEWEERGFLENFREELEYDFLHSCYLRFLKVLVYRYQTPPLSLFLLLQQLIQKRIPDFLNNSYLQQIEQPDFYKILFQAITLPMNKESFMEFTTSIQRIGM